MDKSKFKKLTKENWLKPDKASTSFVRVSPSKQLSPILGEEWLHDILKPTLKETVPIDVYDLFEVARAAIAYGYFFYPLYALAGEQLFRVAETAVSIKCSEISAPKKATKNFKNKIEYLVLHKVIPENKKERWYAIRKLRNIASHPESQTILPPGNVIGILERITDEINFLFNNTQ